MSRDLGATISELFKSNPALSSDTTFASTESPATPQFANASSGYNFIDDQDDLTAWTQSIPASTTLSQIAGIADPFGVPRTVTRVQFTNASGASITKALAAALNLPQGDLVRRCIEGSFWFYSLKTELPTRIIIKSQKRVPLDGASTTQVLLPPQRWVRHPVDCFTGSDAGSNIELTITEDQFDGTYGDVDMYVCLVAIKDTTAGEIAISNIATGNPTVITLAADHKLQPHTLTQVLINGVTGNTPDFSNDYGAGQTANTYAQYISPTQLSIPVDTTVAGTGGTVTFPFSNLFATTPRADIGEQANSIRLIKRKGILYGGDSIAASSRAGVASYMALAALGVINAGYTQTGAGVVTTATGGDTIEQQLTKIQARSEIEKRSLIGLVACGADGELTDIPAKLATVASIVSEFTSVGNNDYLIMGFHASRVGTAAELASVQNINAQLLALYGDKFLDTYDYMVQRSNATDKAAGLIGSELLNDALHPNDTGLKIFFNGMADRLVLLNYNDGLGSIINAPITHTQRPLDVETQPIANFSETAFTLVCRLSMATAQASLTQSNGIVSIDGNAASLLYADSAGIKTNHGVQLVNPTFAADEILTIAVRGTAAGNINLGVMKAGVWTWAVAAAYVSPTLDTVVTFGDSIQAANSYEWEIREIFAEEKTQAWIEANY